MEDRHEMLMIITHRIPHQFLTLGSFAGTMLKNIYAYDLINIKIRYSFAESVQEGERKKRKIQLCHFYKLCDHTNV